MTDVTLELNIAGAPVHRTASEPGGGAPQGTDFCVSTDAASRLWLSFLLLHSLLSNYSVFSSFLSDSPIPTPPSPCTSEDKELTF